MAHTRFPYWTVLGVAAFWACTGGEVGQTDETARDLSLAPADSLFVLNDQPLPTPAAEQSRQLTRPPISEPLKPIDVQPTLMASPELYENDLAGELVPLGSGRSASRRLGSGTFLTLEATHAVSSKGGNLGDPVSATLPDPARNRDGEVIIPAGAVFRGAISKIDRSGGNIRMSITFNSVEFDGVAYPIEARAYDVNARRTKRGASLGDVAKGLGTGAILGGLVGGVIGGSGKGAAVGAAVGGAAGAASTRGGWDVTLDVGSQFECILNGPFQPPRFILRPIALGDD